VFTLYPGGMFGLNSDRSDMMLRRVTFSPCFRKVIVTQRVTYDYLVKNNFCPPDKIEYIYGGVIPISEIELEVEGKSYYSFDRKTLEICFVANKYTEKGVDKGYDVFIEIAKILCGKYNNINFHVVGRFDENDIDIQDIKDKITFYGFKLTGWFDKFYKDKDIIISPNVPFILHNGSFDGFPTGTCVDAGLRKMSIFCTDELHLNEKFINGEEIVIIPHDAVQATKIIEGYYKNPDKLKQIAENGYRKMKNVFSYDEQTLPRINILKDQIKQSENSINAIINELGSRE
jgi:glycosyltransferase involved in cell wall biosynthesis